MIAMRTLILLLTLYICQPGICQPDPKRAAQMNFMIGKWDLHANGSLMGKSIVATILENHVMEENFIEFPPEPFLGKNWTTYNSETNR